MNARPAAGRSPSHEAGLVAYISMEIALEAHIPTYAGGLGVLAGDTLRAAADLGVPMVGITLLHRGGYFRQQLDREHGQREEPAWWSPRDCLESVPFRTAVSIEGRRVEVAAWKYVIRGAASEVPVFLLDTDLDGNTPEDRELTHRLYGGDGRYRLAQEVVLGYGGAGMLLANGYSDLATYHINEGHGALIAPALAESRLSGLVSHEPPSVDRDALRDSLYAVKQHVVFTTHTPVPAGHDQFPLDLARQVLGDARVEMLMDSGCCIDGTLNMTHVGLRCARYINGVALRHGEISRGMFPGYPIASITNGVHAGTWIAPPMGALLDRYVPRWRDDSLSLRYAVGIPPDEVREAHGAAKRDLLAEVNRRTGIVLNPEAFTIGAARRATPYKRLDLLFSDPDRLRTLVERYGRLQVVMSGKAHPHDGSGKETIRHILELGESLRGLMDIVYLENYDMSLAGFVCAGADLWLNTPLPPLEASGTSGMKAALNGVPSLSILDGWWAEGHIEGVTGWAIGDGSPRDRAEDAASLYDQLEHHVLPMFYDRPEEYAHVMRSALAINGSFFNTHRMLLEYVQDAYTPAAVG